MTGIFWKYKKSKPYQSETTLIVIKCANVSQLFNYVNLRLILDIAHPPEQR